MQAKNNITEIVLTVIWLLTLCITGCAPSLKQHNFIDENPLFKKRIGIFYDRKIIGSFEGLDEHDSKEYFTALVSAMSKYSGNVTFIDMTKKWSHK